MKKIPVDHITDGMVLAKEVHGKSGNVLLSKGLALNSFLGRRLKNWEIACVFIEGEDDSPEQKNETKVSPQEVREHLEQKFGTRLQSSIMKQIFTAVYQHKTSEGAA